jgi:hypothetical protein
MGQRQVASAALPDAPVSAPLPQSIVIFPPEYLPPEAATMFNPYVQVASAAVQTLPLWTFNVPQSSILVIKSLDFWATNTSPTSNIVFNLLVNGAPYPGYGTIPLFPGAAAINSRSFNDLTLRFYEGVVVQINVTNGDGAAYTLAASAQGWYYSKLLGSKYQGSL